MDLRPFARASRGRPPPLSAFLLFVLLGVARSAEGASCLATDVNCGYFGCFPVGTTCPADCDTFLDPASCHAVKAADGRQACMYNPQYSLGKGLCQKAVTCFDLEGGKCSDECFRCGYFGCLPDGTDCPALCEEFGDPRRCADMGGVAGGMACQWNVTAVDCQPVPLAQLTRTLEPAPLLAHPAPLIRNGATITPSAFPNASPTSSSAPFDAPPPMTWKGASGRPNRLALYIGLAIAALGLICAAALVYHQRSKKRELNKALALGVPRQGGGRPTLSSAMAPGGDENRPRTQFRRGSLIVHIRQALGEPVQKDQQSSGGGAALSSDRGLGSSPTAAAGQPSPAVSAAAAAAANAVAEHAQDSASPGVRPAVRSVEIRTESSVEPLGSGHCLSPALHSPIASPSRPIRRMSAPPSPLSRLSSGDYPPAAQDGLLREIVADPADDRPATSSVDDDKIWRRSPSNAEEEAAWRNAVLSGL